MPLSAGLDDAILARRPTDQCNSIAWLLWHMTRVVDTFVHTRLQAQPQVWIRDGWYAKFGMAADPDNRGSGVDLRPKWRSGFHPQKRYKWVTTRRSNRLTRAYLATLSDTDSGSAARHPPCARAAHRGCRLGTDDLGQRGARWSNRVPARPVSGHGLVHSLAPSLPLPPREGWGEGPRVPPRIQGGYRRL